MKALKALILSAAGVVLVSPLLGEGLLKQFGAWTPFLERLEPNEFLAVEHALGGTASDGSPDLLIYHAHGKDVSTAISLTKLANKTCRLQVVDPETGKPLRNSVLLPVDIADRLLSVMELALTTQLYPPTGKAFHYPEERENGRSYWINLRINKSVSLGGVVLVNRCTFGQDSVSPFLMLMGSISDIAGADHLEDRMLVDLDLAISALRLSYPAKR